VSSPTSTGAVIEVRGLSKRFGSIEAVRGLDFSVVPGRVTGFLGPNGAGKTTTLRMLLGLVTPTAGTATIFGRRYAELADPVRHVGAVLEATSFHPARRARQHLKMMTLASGIAESRIDEVLGLVGLADSAQRRVGGFSLGMRQRLELAGALLGDPDVLILDEPSNGLDPQGIAWLREFLRHLAAQGRTILVSSHLLAEMAQTVDDVVIVSGGQLRAQGPLATLSAQAHSSMRIRTPEVPRLLGVLAAAGFPARQSATDTVMADGATPEALGPVLAANQIVLYELAHEGTDLESMFLSLTGPVAGAPGAPGGGQVPPPTPVPQRPLGPPPGYAAPPPPPQGPVPPGPVPQ
jgi:ABC-2 type transport system ATP-binding protein